MASFCNPKVFESPAHFRKYYDRPILAGREPGATDKEVQLATERQEEMNRHCNDFILRRTNDILSDHLPPKVKIGFHGRCFSNINTCTVRVFSVQRSGLPEQHVL